MSGECDKCVLHAFECECEECKNKWKRVQMSGEFENGGRMNDTEEKELLRRIAKLEQHVINLIIPIQSITKVLSSPQYIQELLELLKKPLTIDDRAIASCLAEFKRMMIEFSNESKALNISQTLGEIKFIGKRLHEIEQSISDMKNEGVKKKIHLDLTVDGYEMVKRKLPMQNPELENEEDPEEATRTLLTHLNEREGKVLVHRFGLFGEKKKTQKQIAKLFGLTSGESIRRIECIALRKCRHPTRKKFSRKITHTELRMAIMGE